MFTCVGMAQTQIFRCTYLCIYVCTCTATHKRMYGCIYICITCVHTQRPLFVCRVWKCAACACTCHQRLLYVTRVSRSCQFRRTAKTLGNFNYTICNAVFHLAFCVYRGSQVYNSFNYMICLLHFRLGAACKTYEII